MYLLKQTNVYRVETINDVLKLRKYLEGPNSQGELQSFSYTTKPIKEGKEVVGEYQQVKATLVIDNEKEPEGNCPIYIEMKEEG